jgi:hypothetical protein
MKLTLRKNTLADDLQIPNQDTQTEMRRSRTTRLYANTRNPGAALPSHPFMVLACHHELLFVWLVKLYHCRKHVIN